MKILILLLAPPLHLHIHTCVYAHTHTYAVPSLLGIPDSRQLGAQTPEAAVVWWAGALPTDVGTEAQQASGNGTPA